MKTDWWKLGLAGLGLGLLIYKKDEAGQVITRATDSAIGLVRDAVGYVNGISAKIKLTSIGGGHELRDDAAQAWFALLTAAKGAGHNLTVNSAFRDNSQQAYLYNLYKTGKGNLAAPPGWSNHQMGTAIDIGGIGGFGTPAFNWLVTNASYFGFINDVKTEFWHWHFIPTLAQNRT